MKHSCKLKKLQIPAVMVPLNMKHSCQLRKLIIPAIMVPLSMEHSGQLKKLIIPAVMVPLSLWNTVANLGNLSKLAFLNSSSSVTKVDGLPRFPLISTATNSSYNVLKYGS